MGIKKFIIVTIIVLFYTITACGNTEGVNTIAESVPVKNADATPIPSDGFRNIEIELTNDAMPEQIIKRLYEITGEDSSGRGSEMLVSQGSYGVQIMVLDGPQETHCMNENLLLTLKVKDNWH